jgi:hypothetical protein
MDWEAVLRAKNVPFVTHGKNVGRNNIAISCPFCGDDPSQHLNLSLDRSRPYFYCFRNASHRGRNPYPLLKKLFGEEEAKRIMKDEPFQPYTPPVPKNVVRMPFRISSIGEVDRGKDLERILRYLVEVRKMTREDTAAELMSLYRLMLGKLGAWKDRVIIPFITSGHEGSKALQVVGATGRAMRDHQTPRYFTIKGDGCPPFLGTHLVSLCVERVFLCEGPFDMLKLSYWMLLEGMVLGADASVLAYTGESLRTPHVAWLIDHLHPHTKVVVIPDRDSEADLRRRCRSMQTILSPFFPTYAIELPEGIKDPDGIPDSGTFQKILSEVLLR